MTLITPLHIELMIHYRTASTPWPRPTVTSRAYTDDLIAWGMIRWLERSSGYRATDGGKKWVDAICADYLRPQPEPVGYDPANAFNAAVFERRRQALLRGFHNLLDEAARMVGNPYTEAAAEAAESIRHQAVLDADSRPLSAAAIAFRDGVYPARWLDSAGKVHTAAVAQQDGACMAADDAKKKPGRIITYRGTPIGRCMRDGVCECLIDMGAGKLHLKRCPFFEKP